MECVLFILHEKIEAIHAVHLDHNYWTIHAPIVCPSHQNVMNDLFFNDVLYLDRLFIPSSLPRIQVLCCFCKKQ